MTNTRSQALVGGGAALTAVSAVLPWLVPSSAAQEFASDSGDSMGSISGIAVFTEGLQPLFSGPVVAGIAIALVAVALVAGGNQWADAGVIVGGGIVALVAAIWILAPGTIVGGGMGGAMLAAFLSPGIGLFLTILGGILILAGGVMSYTDDGAGSTAVPA